MPAQPLYDRIGRGYATTRREDPHLARAIWAALGDARTVVNVGAGTGAYEPRDREVLAVEPSETMIAQRAPGAAPVLRAQAEDLPLEDGSVDAAMAVLSDHHWADRAQGLRELRRVARDRVVVFTFDSRWARRSWLVAEYLPAFSELGDMAIEEVARHLGGAEIRRVPVPHDCRDGFLHAFWRRPEAYLDARVRAGISVFSLLPAEDVHPGIDRLAADLETGAWHARHADLLPLDELDLGYRLVVAGAPSHASVERPSLQRR